MGGGGRRVRRGLDMYMDSAGKFYSAKGGMCIYEIGRQPPRLMSFESVIYNFLGKFGRVLAQEGSSNIGPDGQRITNQFSSKNTSPSETP